MKASRSGSAGCGRPGSPSTSSAPERIGPLAQPAGVDRRALARRRRLRSARARERRCRPRPARAARTPPRACAGARPRRPARAAPGRCRRARRPRTARRNARCRRRRAPPCRRRRGRAAAARRARRAHAGAAGGRSGPCCWFSPSMNVIWRSSRAVAGRISSSVLYRVIYAKGPCAEFGSPARVPHDRLSACDYIVSCAFAAPRDVRLSSRHFRVRAFPVAGSRVAERPAAGAARPDRPLDAAPRPASLAAGEPAAARAAAPPRPSGEARSPRCAIRQRARPTLDLPLAVQPVALRRPRSSPPSRPRARSASTSRRSSRCRPSDFALYLNAAERALGRQQRAPLLLDLDAQGSGRQGGRLDRAGQPAGGRHQRRRGRAIFAGRRLADHAAGRRAPATSAMSPSADRDDLRVTLEHLPAEALL